MSIAAVTGAWTIVRHTLLSPFGFAIPPDLVSLRHGTDRESGDWYTFSDIRTLQQFHQVFDSVVAYGFLRPAQPVHVDGSVFAATTMLVSTGYFEALELGMQAGRPFIEAEGEDGAAPVAVLSSRFAARAFGGVGHAIGREIEIADTGVVVIGVVPEGFRGTNLAERPDVFLPLVLAPRVNPVAADWVGERSPMWLRAHARLRPRLSAAAVNDILASQMLLHPPGAPTYISRTRAVDLREAAIPPQIWSRFASLLRLLSVSSAVVLIAGCIAGCSVFLGRSERRRRDLAICSALGAARWRLAAACWADALWITAAGALLAVPLTMIAIQGYTRIVTAAGLTPDLAYPVEPESLLGISAIALVFSIIMTAASWRTAVGGTLYSLETGTREVGVPGRVARGVLIGLQAAAAMTLIGVGALLIRTTGLIQAVDLGFRADEVVEARVELAATRIDPVRRSLLYEDIERQLRESLPQSPVAVAGREWLAAVTSVVDGDSGAGFTAARARRQVLVRTVTKDYFEALGVPLVRGRGLDPDAPAVGVVVSERLARLLGSAESVIGAKLGPGVAPPPARVIGIVADHTTDALSAPGPTAYVHIGILPEAALSSGLSEVAEVVPKAVTFLVRTSRIATVEDVVRRNLAAWPSASATVQTMDQQARAATAHPRVLASLFGVLGLTVLALSCASIAVLVSSNVVSRRRETGVRMALGAKPSDLVRLFGREIILSVAGGIGLGLLVIANGGTLVRSLLFETTPSDPLSLLGAGILLLGIASVAVLVAILCATRGEPAALLGDS